MGIVGIVAFLTVLSLSLIITKLATVALTMTGLSPDIARFQARSAFTGTGFTSSETEKVVDTRDYYSLLNLSGEYNVRKLYVREGDWLSGNIRSQGLDDQANFCPR